MNEPFVPLFPNAAPGIVRGPEFCQASILSAATARQMQSAAPAAPSAPPIFVPTLAPANPSSPSAPPHGNPVVTLERNGEQITRIHIVCACGQVIDLDCAY